MPNQSVANNSSAPTQAQVPAIRSFQFDHNAIGAIRSGVNYFRGCVQLPVDFLTLTGRDGLDVKLSAMYSSNVRKQIDTWNSEAPTGVLGLGWDMPVEHISVYKSGSGSNTSDSFYLVSGGSANPLIKSDERSSTVWVFQARNYEFWDIQYDTASEVWTIVKEDGMRYVYGGKDPDQNAVQLGVKLGNWIGSSAQLAGQEQYCAAWNLATIESPWGHRVRYTYHNVDQPVGQGGLKFTQASYIRTVVDSFDRTIIFNYQDKFGANHPGRGIIEYQAQNAAQPEPNGYQDRYETLYLNSVDVRNADGSELYQLQFTYDFLNFANQSDPAYPLLYKRVLKSVFQHTPGGESLPGMKFEYGATNDVNPGALKAVTYPTGGVARMAYKKTQIASPKRVTVTNPLQGSTPGVWHGDDYVAFTFCQPGDTTGFKVIVQSWNGRWVQKDISGPGMATVNADPRSVRVIARNSFLLVSYRNTTASQDEVFIYQRDEVGFGDWKLYDNQPFAFKVTSNDTASQIDAGTDFVVAYNRNYASGQYKVLSYSWKTGQWTPPVILPESGADDGSVIAAQQNYYIVARCFQSQSQVKFQILFRDLDGTWQARQPWTAGSFPVELSGNGPLLSLAPNPTYLVATHVTGSDSTKISYRLDAFDWDESFYVLNPSNPAQVTLESPINGNASVYDVFRTISTGSFVNNNPANLRNLGQYANNSGVNWVTRKFTPPAATSRIETAAGQDVAILCENKGSSQQNSLMTFNPNFPSDSGWSSGSVTQSGRVPTITGNYMTVGKTIYSRSFSGEWLALSTQLNTLTAEETVQNRAPDFIAYQDKDDATARSYFVPLKNGQAGSPTELPGGAAKIYVPPEEVCAGPGTNLVGQRFIVSYSSASRFCDADQLHLQNIDEGDVSDFVYDYPVAYIEIDDAFNPSESFVQSYFYANSDTSQIAYNAATGVSQYPLVYEVAGIKSTAPDVPTHQPYGRSERYYSNGMSPQAGIYPQGWVYNYQNLLNGMLLAQKDFDSANNLVHTQTNLLKVTTEDRNGNRLYGGYARSVQTQTLTDNVTSTLYVEYDDTTGLELRREQQYFDSEGNARIARTEKKYAWQVPEYQSTFLQHHLYTSVAQETQSVIAAGGTERNYVSSSVTTYRNWAEDEPGIACKGQTEADCRIAPYEQYEWTTPGATAPTFNFAFGADRHGWLMKSVVVNRSRTSGVINEQRNLNTVPTSFLYDKQQRYRIAEFPNGSLDGDEVSYYGFEEYEDAGGWTLGTKARIVPDRTDTTIDAHTGLRSLELAASTTGSDGISRSFSPARKGISYVFSAWVKKPLTFDNAKGNGCWQINVAGGDNLTAQFPETVGEWVYVSQVFEIPTGSGEVQILGQNLNSSSPVLVDNIRFSPLTCLFEGTAYDTHFWLQNAGLGANGECDRIAYDSMQRPVVRTNGADRIKELASAYLSRSGNQGTFSTSDPNHEAAIKPADGGTLSTFTRGAQWQQQWKPNDNAWQVQSAILTQVADDTPGTLTARQEAYRTDYALEVGLETRETVTSPLGVRFGTDLKVQWNPQTLAWELLDGAAVKSTTDIPLFTVPVSPIAEQLNNNQISEQLQNLFNQAGYPLPDSSTVSAGSTAGTSWELTSPTNRFRYDLLQDGESITVHRVGGNWTALVVDQALLFYVDGQQIFSYQAEAPLTDAPAELFFGTRVAVSRLCITGKPQAEVNYQDSRGNTIQMQGLEHNRTVVSQTILDELGRASVRTKAAYVTPEVTPLLAFCPNFASINWTTGAMTGLVNDAYPEDAGYPYSRETYERSPLGRVVEKGAPGAQFCIGAHSIHIRYEDEAAKFYKVTTTNQNGDVFYELSNELEQVVSRVAVTTDGQVRNETLYDDAGNPHQRRSPNYFEPPAGSQPTDWVETQTFTYAGQTATSRSGTHSETKYIYDPAGNLRFMQDPTGATDGNFNYVKYDQVGRQIESGYITDTWNTETLQNKANTDRAWPPTPQTWRKKYSYDGNQQIKHAIGRITQVQVNNTDDGQPDVVEEFRYDILGNTVLKTLKSTQFESGADHQVDYEYDNLNLVTRTVYPAINESPRLSIYQRYNRLNQMTAIAETASFTKPLATFSYSANGQPQQESLTLGDQQMTSLFDYNSPLWLRNINQQNPIGETLFGESLTYTEGGFHTDGTDAKYFDGTIASATSSGTNDQSFRYSYNSVGAVENAESMPETNWSLGVTQNVAYDPNGNFQSLFRGGIQKTYNYFDGTQRVKDVVNADGSTAASYEYDPNGNTTLANSAATGLSAAHNLHFTYDAGTKMASRVTDTVAGGSTLNLWYGHDNDRVQKDILNGTSLVAQKLYIRGLNSHPICELTSQDGVITPVIYIYGPNGLLAMRRAEDTFGILKDHLGSTRAVVDSSATVIAQYNYLTFGALGTIQEPFSGFMPYLFTGQEFDHEIGLYNYRARFYSAELGRFLAVDPVAQFFSPYIYASNNPVLFVDPTGGISTWARVLFGVAMAVVGVAVIGLTIATGGATAPAVAAWAAGLGASASVAAGVGAVAAVTASAALGAASGAALSSSMYALSTSNEDFSWGRLGQNAALGAIAGAVTGGVAQGISLGGQAVATAVTGVSEAGAKWAAGVTSKALISYAARSAAIGGIASGIGGAAGSGVSGAVSNVWGLTDYGPGEMAVSILTGLGTGAAKGAAGGIAGAAAAKVKAPLTNKWNSLSAKTQTRVKVGGAVAGVVAVGGTYGYLYDREATREAALA